MTRVTHRQTGKTGRIQWQTPTVAGVRWDDPLTSGPGTVPRALLVEHGTTPDQLRRRADQLEAQDRDESARMLRKLADKKEAEQ